MTHNTIDRDSMLRRMVERRLRRKRLADGWWQVVAVGLIALTGASCSLDGLLHSDQLPPSVSDPAITQTPAGARAAYTGTLAQFRKAFGGDPDGHASFVITTAELTDEIKTYNGGAGFELTLDRRVLPEGQSIGYNTYSALQKTRGQASQATGLLATYVPEEPALRGHLYALQGYAELFLAELFCSGIPLSTLDFNGDFTYKPGSTTEEILRHAVTLFDTALVLAGDSARFVQLAQVGRARALLGLGAYADAATGVGAVPDDYHYDVTYANTTTATGSFAGNWRNFARILNGYSRWDFTVPNREGSNGMDWRTSSDPRVPVDSSIFNGFYVYYPSKYNSDGASPIILASGVEARMIEAESALQAGDVATWLAKLNALRTDGTYDTTATSPPDTLWHAGTGGMAGLAPLADPGTVDGRVDLLFRERAFWLYLTGHRQGDLRRLIRQYGRTQAQVYPVGAYNALQYGSDVTVPPPVDEQIANPLYTGCATRGA